MNNEKIFKLGEKLGLNEKEIEYTLTKRISDDKQFSISYESNCYKNGTMYGTVSVNDM